MLLQTFYSVRSALRNIFDGGADMHDLQVFEYEGSAVRTVEKDGEPWFVAADVCNVLELSNVTVVVSRLDEDERSKFNLGRQGETLAVNEAGLYSLILGSRKPEAKKFKRWVTHEVIPSIRKHGVYAIDEVLQNPDVLINALQALKAEREEKERLALECAFKAQQIAELHPKADYHDKVLACPDLVKVTVIAKDYGWSAVRLNQWLEEKKIQFKQGEQWILYQKYAEKGYTQSFTYNYTRPDGSAGNSMITKWTQKGRLFIYDLLKADGILPNCEKE